MLKNACRIYMVKKETILERLLVTYEVLIIVKPLLNIQIYFELFYLDYSRDENKKPFIYR